MLQRSECDWVRFFLLWVSSSEKGLISVGSCPSKATSTLQGLYTHVPSLFSSPFLYSSGLPLQAQDTNEAMVDPTNRARSGNTQKTKQKRAESKCVSWSTWQYTEWVNTLYIWEQDLLLTTALIKTTEINSEVKVFSHSPKNKPGNLSILGHMVFSFNSFLFYNWEKKRTVLQIIPSPLPLAVVSTQLWLDSTLFHENPWWNAVCLPAALSVWLFEFLKQL